MTMHAMNQMICKGVQKRSGSPLDIAKKRSVSPITVKGGII